MTTARQLWDTIRSYLVGPTMKLSEMLRYFERGTTATGGMATNVNEDTALALSAVWNAVQIISGSVGSLPLVLYKRTAEGDREAMRWHPLYRILHDEPNPDMSAMDFRETLQAHVLTWGNAFAEITRNGLNQVARLDPIHPSRVSLHRNGAGALYYEVTNASTGSAARIDQRNMLHVKGPSPDGVWGYSVIGKARQSMGYTMAAEHFGAAFYGNATIHGGVVKHPGRLSEQAHARLLHDLEARHKGGVNAFKLAILEEGMSWESMGMPLTDAQFLEGRTFQIQEIARWFNIPLHMLKELTHATFCLPGEAQVLTESGPKAIAEVTIGERVWSRTDDARWVLQSVTASACTGEDEILEIRAGLRTVRCNARHRIPVRRRSLIPWTGGRGRSIIIDGVRYRQAWTTTIIPAGEIRPGDELLALNGLDAGGGTASPTRAVCTPAFMEVLGMLIGDGFYARDARTGAGSTVGISHDVEARYLPHYLAAIEAEFTAGGTKILRHHRRDKNTTVFYSTRMYAELAACGMAGTAKTKRVPAWIFGLNDDLKLAFLRGYLDADGTVNRNGQIRYVSVNQLLLNDVRHLAMSAGIRCGNLFSTEIESQFGGQIYRHTLWAFICTDEEDNDRIGTHTALYKTRIGSRIASLRMRLRPMYPNEAKQRAQEPGILFTRVRSVRTEPIRQRVYNLTVEETHNFVADGVVVRNSNIEHQSQEFVIHTLRPWFVKWEHELNRKLIAPSERTIQYFEHNAEGLLRGDIESRYRAYATARNWGWMNANTICQKENLPRLPGEQGEIYLVPANMIPAEQVGKLIESEQILPAEVSKDTEPPDEPEDAEEPEEAERTETPMSNGHDARRRAHLITAFRLMIADVVRRHLAREKDKAKTAATHGPDRFRAWMTDFYPRYADVFRTALLPAVQIHLALTESEQDADSLTRTLVEAHVAESRRQLWTLLEAPPADLRLAVEDLLARWDLQRTNVIPDALMVEEITHGH